MIRSLAALALAGACFAQTPRGPDVEAQRAAMKKLDFLAGKWSGPATVQRGPGAALELTQTEDVQWKGNGLVLLIEGTGRKPDGEIVFNALATISYDDAAKSYRIRAHNDGRFIDAELVLAADGKGFTWGFAAGPGKTHYVMRITESGEWHETGEFIMGERPPMKFVELRVRPVK